MKFSLAAWALLVPRAALAWGRPRYDPSPMGLAISMLPFCSGLGMALYLIYRLTTPPKADPNAPLDADSQKLHDGLAALDQEVDEIQRAAAARPPAAETADPLLDAPPAPDDAPPPPPHRPRGLL